MDTQRARTPAGLGETAAAVRKLSLVGLAIFALSAGAAPAQVISLGCEPAWHLPPVQNRPFARTRFAMETFDDLSTIVLYGGIAPNGVEAPAETLLWDGGIGATLGVSTGWRPSSSPPLPGTRSDHALAYDTLQRRLVLFGGMRSGVPLGDTYTFDGSIWSAVPTSIAPSPRFDHAMCYDAARRKIVLFGGRAANGQPLSDTWEFDLAPPGGPRWTLVATQGAPSARFGHTLSRDSRAGHSLLFGGRDNFGVLGDTWSYDGTWTRLADPNNGYAGAQPPARFHHAGYEDRECGGILIHGGELSGNASSTWRWDGFEWKELQTSTNPGPLYDHALAWDPIHSEVLLYGGWNSNAHVSSDQTQQYCCCADDAGIAMNAAGAPILPSSVDPLSVTTTTVNQVVGYVDQLYPSPAYDTSLDTWQDQRPCPEVTDFGVVPPEVDQQNTVAQELCRLLNLPSTIVCPSPQEVEARMRQFEDTIQTLVSLQPNPLETAGPAAEPYTPGPPHCVTDPGGCPSLIAPRYIAGGRDLLFVHGFMPEVILDKLFARDGRADDAWSQPSAFPAVGTNPEYYGNGYFATKARQYWASHINRFLASRGILNRYLIVSWNSNSRITDAAQAMLTQINDAMQYGTGVYDPQNPNGITSNFGNPSFVVISHSTGSLVTDIAMSAAANATQHPSLRAGYIAERCKAHIALHGAFGGSRFATAVVAISGMITGVAVNHPWICHLVDTIFWTFGLNGGFAPAGANPCALYPAIADSVLVDLVPAVAQNRWGPYVASTPVRTVTIAGGHPSTLFPLKNIFHPGFDDGTVTMNSQLANPNQALFVPFLSPGWPSGFNASGGLLAPVHLFDRGAFATAANGGIDHPLRAIYQFFDQYLIDPRLAPGTAAILSFSSGSAVPWLSPMGMLQPVGAHFPLNGGRNPLRRAPNHFSYIQSSADHMSGAINVGGLSPYPDYYPTSLLGSGAEANREEVRVITDPAIYDRYLMPHPDDDDPLLDPRCTPRVQESVRGKKVTLRFRFGSIRWEKSFWLWKRTYHLIEGWEVTHQLDYVYRTLLTGPAVVCNSGRVVPFGSSGIGSSGLALVLSGIGQPDIGTTFTLRLDNARANAAAILIFGAQPLSIPIDPPPLTLYTQPFPGISLLAFTGLVGSASYSIPIPNDPFLSGASLVAQGIVRDSPVGSLGLVGSNGLILGIQ